MRRLLDGLAVFKDWKRFLGVVAWMALNWLIGLLSYWLYMRTFIPEAPFLWAAFLIGAVAVGGTIPSSPGNVAARLFFSSIERKTESEALALRRC